MWAVLCHNVMCLYMLTKGWKNVKSIIQTRVSYCVGSDSESRPADIWQEE